MAMHHGGSGNSYLFCLPSLFKDIYKKNFVYLCNINITKQTVCENGIVNQYRQIDENTLWMKASMTPENLFPLKVHWISSFSERK